MRCHLYIYAKNTRRQHKCLIRRAVRSSDSQLSVLLFYHDRSVAWNRPISVHYDRDCPAAKKTYEASREDSGRYHRRHREQWFKLTWFLKGNVFFGQAENYEPPVVH
jgi:hypothetical protein